MLFAGIDSLHLALRLQYINGALSEQAEFLDATIPVRARIDSPAAAGLADVDVMCRLGGRPHSCVSTSIIMH